MRIWLSTLLFVLACQSGPDPVVYELVPVGPLVMDEPRQVYLTGSTQPEASQRLTWTSSDPEVITVSPTGVVRGIRPGHATISVEDDFGRGQAPVEVSHASVAWSAPLAAARRSFLAVSESGWVFAKVVDDQTCDWLCPGTVHALNADGQYARSLTDVGSIIAGETYLWFEQGDDLIGRWNFREGEEEVLVAGRRLLGQFENGDFLIGLGDEVLRIDEEGNEQDRWSFDAATRRAVILGPDRFAVSTGAKVTVVSGTDRESHHFDWPVLPWAATGEHALVLSDQSDFGFWLYDSDGEQTPAGRYSVLVGPDKEVIQSEGLSASLSVPVEVQKGGSSIFLQLHSQGVGETSYVDVIYRRGEEELWRWGPSNCADHPFAVVVGDGYALLSDCDRLVRIDDETLRPSGAWPQPGADGARTWRVQQQ